MKQKVPYILILLGLSFAIGCSRLQPSVSIPDSPLKVELNFITVAMEQYNPEKLDTTPVVIYLNAHIINQTNQNVLWKHYRDECKTLGGSLILCHDKDSIKLYSNRNAFYQIPPYDTISFAIGYIDKYVDNESFKIFLHSIQGRNYKNALLDYFNHITVVYTPVIEDYVAYIKENEQQGNLYIGKDKEKNLIYPKNKIEISCKEPSGLIITECYGDCPSMPFYEDIAVMHSDSTCFYRKTIE